MRLAVCLHLYYREQAEEFRRLLNNLRMTGILFDLFITGMNLHEQDIDSFKNIASNTTFIPTDNRGYDIAPFIVFLHKINLPALFQQIHNGFIYMRHKHLIIKKLII